MSRKCKRIQRNTVCANNKFCCRPGEDRSETHRMPKTVYGNEALFCTHVSKWLKDSEVSGPWRWSKEWVAITAWHLEAVVKVCEMVARDHSMTLKLMEDQLHINRGTSHQIPREDFGKRQIWVKFVPHGLMDKLILPWQ